ncbi:MAG: hypothetical protein JW395_1502 [Nitrospira sp.]|nr:hypothetical protein [Nitrospira sp.]
MGLPRSDGLPVKAAFVSASLHGAMLQRVSVFERILWRFDGCLQEKYRQRVGCHHLLQMPPSRKQRGARHLLRQFCLNAFYQFATPPVYVVLCVE